MSFWNRVFGKREVPPAQPSGGAKQDSSANTSARPLRPVFMQRANDSRIRVDVATISHAFIALSLRERHLCDKAASAVADFNRHCQPRVWNVPFKAKFVVFSVSEGNDGFPDGSSVPITLESMGMSPRASVVINMATVSFDRGHTQSNIVLGFCFTEAKPRIILPVDRREDGIVPA